MEDFVDIIGYEGLYRINRNGDIWSCKSNRLMKHSLNNQGYHCVCFYKEKNTKIYSIHRLLGIHFIPNPDNLPEIDHIDRNPLNNNLENLRWVSKSTNQQNKGRYAKNKTGYKNISSLITKSKNGFINEYWVIQLRLFKCILSYPKNKYTLEDVVEFRNKIYIDNNIQRYD